MDYILEDSVDECNLTDPNNDLVVTIPKMFTDEHTPDYSSPPLYDDVNDDLVELESDNDDVYEYTFDSNEDKIKESKLLIDELDPPRSIDFLPFLEYDSVLYEDFFEVDALPSTNIENKDFNPRLYELPFHKEVLGSKTLLLFSSENEEKVFNPGIHTSKGVYTSLLPELSHRGPKASKSLKFSKARWRFFLALIDRTSVSWMFRFSISIPLDKLKYGGSSQAQDLFNKNKRFVTHAYPNIILIVVMNKCVVRRIASSIFRVSYFVMYVQDFLNFKDSFSWFVLRSLDLHNLNFILGI
nr:hypothetical protein [Tanacetum cinerariifolium]